MCSTPSRDTVQGGSTGGSTTHSTCKMIQAAMGPQVPPAGCQQPGLGAGAAQGWAEGAWAAGVAGAEEGLAGRAGAGLVGQVVVAPAA